MQGQEDVHFLIDNVSPKEAEYLLRCLMPDRGLSTSELREYLETELNYRAQRNLSFSIRRLCDLGIAAPGGAAHRRPSYQLTPLGAKVRNLLEIDRDLFADIMHFLHYSGYDGTPSSRKLFWSYKCCCEIVWQQKSVPRAGVLATEVQARIANVFPELYSARMGGNFNAGGVSAWKTWLANLAYPPFSESGREVILRIRSSFELALLSLDNIYRSRGYRYGDPVVLDEPLLSDLSGIFFLDTSCYRELLSLAAKLTRLVSLRDTFAGTSVTLQAPYGVADI